MLCVNCGSLLFYWTCEYCGTKYNNVEGKAVEKVSRKSDERKPYLMSDYQFRKYLREKGGQP